MRRQIDSRGQKQHLVEGEERDRACGLPTLLLDEMSTCVSRLLLQALPPEEGIGFPFFVQMCGQNGGRVSEFAFEEQRYEVVVRRTGKNALRVLAAAAQAYLDCNADEGVLEDEEWNAIVEALRGVDKPHPTAELRQ